jgi:hypothetical protein
MRERTVMASHMRMSGARAMSAATVLSLGLLCASSAAQADYSYSFTLTPLNTGGASASGSFTLGGPIVPSVFLFTSVNANLSLGGGSYALNSVQIGSNLNISSSSLSAIFDGPGHTLGIFGTTIVTSNEIRGAINTTVATSSSFSSGQSFFDATLSSGGGSGGSGGVPTPEVNAGLGIVLAGATFAFLRRKRGGRLEATAA